MKGRRIQVWNVSNRVADKLQLPWRDVEFCIETNKLCFSEEDKLIYLHVVAALRIPIVGVDGVDILEDNSPTEFFLFRGGGFDEGVEYS